MKRLLSQLGAALFFAAALSLAVIPAVEAAAVTPNNVRNSSGGASTVVPTLSVDEQGNYVAGGGGGGGGGGASTIADGADVTQGAVADAVVAAGAAGTEAAKLRRLTTDLGTLIGKDFSTQTTLAAVLAKIIAAPATEAKQDTANTSLAIIDDVGAGVAVTLTRTSDTNAYLANDVIGAATGSTAALSFANVGPSGREVMLTSASLKINATAVISGETSYNLYCYPVTPPSALGDNAPFDIPSGDQATAIYKIPLGTPVDEGSTLLVQSDSINKQITLSGTGIFCYLVTVGAYTPTSARVYVLNLHFVPM